MRTFRLRHIASAPAAKDQSLLVVSCGLSEDASREMANMDAAIDLVVFGRALRPQPADLKALVRLCRDSIFGSKSAKVICGGGLDHFPVFPTFTFHDSGSVYPKTEPIAINRQYPDQKATAGKVNRPSKDK